ncbi:hypothetical protein LCGC14_1581240, partial [marine sediment metagenome]
MVQNRCLGTGKEALEILFGPSSLKKETKTGKCPVCGYYAGVTVKGTMIPHRPDDVIISPKKLDQLVLKAHGSDDKIKEIREELSTVQGKERSAQSTLIDKDVKIEALKAQ